MATPVVPVTVRVRDKRPANEGMSPLFPTQGLVSLSAGFPSPHRGRILRITCGRQELLDRSALTRYVALTCSSRSCMLYDRLMYHIGQGNIVCHHMSIHLCHLCVHMHKWAPVCRALASRPQPLNEYSCILLCGSVSLHACTKACWACRRTCEGLSTHKHVLTGIPPEWLLPTPMVHSNRCNAA
jgi:hypothetical protein